MLHGEINIGDVLEWKTFGGQSTKILIVKADEIMVYGNSKGKDKKYKSAFWIRALHAFDDEPELIEETALRANSKRVAGDATGAPDNNSPINDFGAEAEAAETERDYDDEFSQAEPQQARQLYSQDAPNATEQPKKPLAEKPPYKR